MRQNMVTILAQQLKAKILICHAINIPVEIPQSGIVAWPNSVYDDLTKDSKDEMDELKHQLMADKDATGYQPEIDCIDDAGFVTDVINAKAVQHQVDLIVISAHGNDVLGTWMIGNHSRNLIETAIVPLLLVPAAANPRPIERIAFAGDFKQPDKDLQTINKLAGFAKALNAELILTHIDQSNGRDTTSVAQVIMALINKIDYEKVSFKIVRSDQVEKGLKWLTRHLHIDMIALAHYQHNFFDRLIKGSYTQKAASLLNVPLLVFKAKQ